MILRPDVMVLEGHVLDRLADLPSGRAQTCVTSPPYWGLRDYGVPGVAWSAVRFAPMAGLPEVDVPAWTGCLGLEPEPLAFVGHLVHVFREVRRVLKDDGTLWLNLGNSYAGSWGAQGRQGKTGALAGRTACAQRQVAAAPKKASGTGSLTALGGLKAKDLLGIPWRVAFALQADGWWLRSDVIWAKPNPMPGPWRDRPVTAHEYVFLLAKSDRYFYDADAVREPHTSRPQRRLASRKPAERSGGVAPPQTFSGCPARDEPKVDGHPLGRNARSVWTITPKPYRGAHFATMPPDLARTCILAGSRPGDVVLDPFNGAGTTGLVAHELGRRYVGVELSPEYVELTRERLG